MKFKAFTIDETRKALYVWRWGDSDGFYVYPLPADNETVDKKGFLKDHAFLMVADAMNSTADEGVYCTQMALDKETGNVYFGFNKAAADNSAFATGLKYYDYAAGKVVSVPAVADKIMGIVINPNKSKLF